MIYLKVEEIKDNTFHTADTIDSSTTRIIDNFDLRLRNIETNTADTIYYLDR